MAAPTRSQVHIDVGLSNVSIKYRNADWAAEKLAPPLLVGKDSNKYWVYGQENFDLADDIRAPGTRGVQVDWTAAPYPYLVVEHSQTHPIPDEVRDDADEPLNMEIDSTEFLTERIGRRLEFDVAAIATKTASFAAANIQDCSKTGKWSDYAASDPLVDVATQKQNIHNSSGGEANVLIIGHKGFVALKNHPKLKEMVKFGGTNSAPGKVTAQAMAELFEVDEVVDAKALYNTAGDGLTRSLSYIWGSNAVLAVRPPAMGIKVLTFMSIFRRKGWRKTETWRQDPERSDFIRVSDKYQPLAISTVAGALFQNII
jgi:hypothetical protein